MEVLEECSGLLSNSEVLDILKSKTYKKHASLATIIYETTEYIESSNAASLSVSDIEDFLKAIKEKNYELTKIEKIQIANIIPQNEVELHLIVEMIEERFTEQQREDLLQIIQDTLNNPSKDDDNNPRKKFKQEPNA